jgi:glycosyltransferase involved in cell wall biosynthesis
VRILYLSPGHPVHDARFIEAIAAAGHQPMVPAVCPHEIGEVQRLLSEARPDVVHAGPIGTLAWLAARAGARPLVSVSWGFDLLGDTRDSEEDRVRWTLSRTDTLLVDCHAAAQVAASLGMAADRIFEIPWGVDLERFRQGQDRLASRKRYGWDGKIVVLSARAHEPKYGAETVVEGFCLAAVSQPDLYLVVLGQGSLTGRLVARVRESGSAASVAFLGEVDNRKVADYLRAADIYVSASRVDGSSVTLLEAMATGLPAVVTDIPGNREWVEPGVTGLLFPVDDAPALGRAILQVAGDASLRQAMGARARTIVEERANWRENRAILDTLYRAAVRAAASPS